MTRLSMKDKNNTQGSWTSLLSDFNEHFISQRLITRNCVIVLNRLVLFLSKGYKLTKANQNVIYFHLLRSFQSNDKYLKDMAYSAILFLLENSSDGLMGVNVLMKDLVGDGPLMKFKAIGILSKILPNRMISEISKPVTQAFRSTCVFYKSQAVISSYRFYFSEPGIIRRWCDDLPAKEENDGVLYKILGFYCKVKKDDLSFLEKQIEKFKSRNGVSRLQVLNMAYLLRNEKIYLTKSILRENLTIKYGNEWCFLQAARLITLLNPDDARPLVPQLVKSTIALLRSKKVILKFAVTRILSALCKNFSAEVKITNKYLEELVSHENKTIRLFSVTILLETGTEETIEQLIKKMPGFFIHLDDNFKILMLETLYNLCKKFQSKEIMLIDFIEASLNGKGFLEFKRRLVAVLDSIIETSKHKERIINLLCAYIEDSQFPEITNNIISIISREVGSQPVPQQYLVHIINRLIVDDGCVRANALFALYNCPSQESSEMDSIIGRFLEDDDERVRQMAEFLVEYKPPRTQNGEIKKFSLDDLNPVLRVKVLENIEDEYIEEEPSAPVKTLTPDGLIKITHEINLTPKYEEIIIKVKKHVFTDCFKLEFNIKNQILNVNMKSSDFCLIAKGENDAKQNYSHKIDEILPFESYQFFIPIKDTSQREFNGFLDYDLVIDDDGSSQETETLKIYPFRITFLDLCRPARKKFQSQSRKTLKYISKGCKSIEEVRKEIMDIMNLKIINEEASKRMHKIELAGVTEDGNGLLIELTINEVNKQFQITNEISVEMEKDLEAIVGCFI